MLGQRKEVDMEGSASVVVTNVADDDGGSCLLFATIIVPKDDDKLPKKVNRVIKDVIIIMCVERPIAEA